MDEKAYTWLGNWLNSLQAEQGRQTELLEKQNIILEQIRKMVAYFYWVAIIGVILAILSALLAFCGGILGI